MSTSTLMKHRGTENTELVTKLALRDLCASVFPFTALRG